MNEEAPQFTDVMIDCETLSLSPHPFLLSIAVGGFNALDDSPVGYWTTAISGDQAGDIDERTLRWWMSQDRRTFLEALGNGLPLGTLEEVLTYLSEDIPKIGASRIWVRGIDHFWLENILKFHGYKTPWRYNQIVDLRSVETAAHLAGYPGYSEPEGTSGPRHSALADVKYQINAARKVMQWMDRS